MKTHTEIFVNDCTACKANLKPNEPVPLHLSELYSRRYGVIFMDQFQQGEKLFVVKTYIRDFHW